MAARSEVALSDFSDNSFDGGRAELVGAVPVPGGRGYDGSTKPVGDPMDPTTPVPDRRRCRRRPCRRTTLVTCLRGTSGLGRSIGLGLHDFSEEGVRLLVSVPLIPGDDVEVGLSPVYQSKAVSVAGTVVWSAPTAGGYWLGIKLDRRLSYAELTVLT